MNNVCFCFPLPFLPFPPISVCSPTAVRTRVCVSTPTSSPTPAPTTPPPPECPPPFPLHTDVAGGPAASPKTRLNDAFPPTGGLALGWAVGSSGNAASDRVGGCVCLVDAALFFLGDGVDDAEGDGAYVVLGAAAAAVEEPLADDAEAHGVCRAGWRNPDVPPTPTPTPNEGPASGGNRSTWAAPDDVAGVAPAPGALRNVEDDDALAACATRSQSCREDC